MHILQCTKKGSTNVCKDQPSRLWRRHPSQLVMCHQSSESISCTLYLDHHASMPPQAAKAAPMGSLISCSGNKWSPCSLPSAQLKILEPPDAPSKLRNVWKDFRLTNSLPLGLQKGRHPSYNKNRRRIPSIRLSIQTAPYLILCCLLNDEDGTNSVRPDIMILDCSLM
jgi:hypothetical protein